MKYLLLIIFVWSSTIAFAQKDGFRIITNPKPVEQKLIQSSKTINTIICDFTQEKHLEYLSVVVNSEGKFWFKKPSILRWEYTDPFKYLIIINQGKITIKDNDKKSEFNLSSNKAFQELNDIIVNSMNGTLIESDKYDIEILENKDLWMVRLVPKSGQVKKILNHMELFFSKSDLSVVKIKMVESDQDYTVINLSNKKFNTAIPASIFEVK